MTHRPLQLTAFIFASASLSLLHARSSFAQQATQEPPKAEAAKPDAAKPDAAKAEPAKPAKTESQIKAGELFSE
ncbi:MAG TPA: hypothetical protein VGJ91_05685, partial [Polyangiaceae bacterium]